MVAVRLGAEYQKTAEAVLALVADPPAIPQVGFMTCAVFADHD